MLVLDGGVCLDVMSNVELLPGGNRGFKRACTGVPAGGRLQLCLRLCRPAQTSLTTCHLPALVYSTDHAKQEWCMLSMKERLQSHVLQMFHVGLVVCLAVLSQHSHKTAGCCWRACTYTPSLLIFSRCITAALSLHMEVLDTC
jgi:hypothetical protein